jgi:hypothetical protein
MPQRRCCDSFSSIRRAQSSDYFSGGLGGVAISQAFAGDPGSSTTDSLSASSFRSPCCRVLLIVFSFRPYSDLQAGQSSGRSQHVSTWRIGPQRIGPQQLHVLL